MTQRDPPDETGRPKRAGDAAQTGAARDEPLFITLRDVELPALPDAPAPSGNEGLVQSDDELQSVPWLGDPVAERAEQRAARRAQVRRDRMRGASDSHAEPAEPTEPAAPPAVPSAVPPAAPQVLVLDADPGSSAPLRELLQGFGFDVQVMTEVPAQPAPWPHVAVFVDAALSAPDGVDGIDLCKQVREQARLPGSTTPLLVLITKPLQPIDRVRAQLAGCDETVYKPWARGSLARVLDARGIALPSDARRA